MNDNAINEVQLALLRASHYDHLLSQSRLLFETTITSMLIDQYINFTIHHSLSFIIHINSQYIDPSSGRIPLSSQSIRLPVELHILRQARLNETRCLIRCATTHTQICVCWSMRMMKHEDRKMFTIICIEFMSVCVSYLRVLCQQ